jgi:hypothetical protein
MYEKLLIKKEINSSTCFEENDSKIGCDVDIYLVLCQGVKVSLYVLGYKGSFFCNAS